MIIFASIKFAFLREKLFAFVRSCLLSLSQSFDAFTLIAALGCELSKISCAPALCLCLIDNISNLPLHHFFLTARHYIYSCKLRNTIPIVQVYTQLVIRSMEIEKQIAFDNNNLASFRKKWATFKQGPSEYNLTNTVN